MGVKVPFMMRVAVGRGLMETHGIRERDVKNLVVG